MGETGEVEETRRKRRKATAKDRACETSMRTRGEVGDKRISEHEGSHEGQGEG